MRRIWITTATLLAVAAMSGQSALAAAPGGPNSKASEHMLNPQPEPPGVVGDQAKICSSVNGRAIKCVQAFPPGPCKADPKARVACKALPPGPCRSATGQAVACKATTGGAPH